MNYMIKSYMLTRIAVESEILFNLIDNKDKNILYIVGPEGGITEEEVMFLKNKGGIEISLGKEY